MTIARKFALLVPPALLAAAVAATVTLAPAVASADERGRVESIASKGTISPVVPVEAGFALSLGAVLLAFAMERRSRR